MSAAAIPLSIPGAFLVELVRFSDERGSFIESWRESDYAAALATEPFVQDNISCSRAGVLRGLHYQASDAQGQMVTIVAGRVFDVLVDLRRSSPTFGKHEGLMLDEASPRQLYMPAGVAHGFYVLSPVAILHYKCTKYYNAATERGVRWNDPDLAIKWPSTSPTLSPRDAGYPLLRDLAACDLPE
jgi:dTDP-4-dehydrorhamnose 3,5-epimerase